MLVMLRFHYFAEPRYKLSLGSLLMEKGEKGNVIPHLAPFSSRHKRLAFAMTGNLEVRTSKFPQGIRRKRLM